jgi:hypothetical protein
MAGRGPQSFNKRQKEQKRKEKQQEKIAKRLERKAHPEKSSLDDAIEELEREPFDATLDAPTGEHGQ